MKKYKTVLLTFTTSILFYSLTPNVITAETLCTLKPAPESFIYSSANIDKNMLVPGKPNIDPGMLIPGDPDIDPGMLLHPDVIKK